jgi:hypothetical protein
LRKASKAILLLLLVFAGGMSPLRAQGPGGTIQGKVVDKSGRSIAGAIVYLSSPAMLGMRIFVTGKTGSFDFPVPAPGVYTLSAESPGYQTLVRDRIILHTGMSFFFSLELEASELDVEVTAQGAVPALDTISSKRAALIDQALVRHIPLARNFADVLNFAPGVISSEFPVPQEASIHGGTVRDNAYILDGVNLTDMFTMAPLANLSFDLTDEIEIISAGQPASQLPAGGGYVNVVSKSGGNSFSGELGLYFMSDGLNKDLWTASQIKDLGAGPVVGDKNLFDASLSLGGPFWAERAWYFLNARTFKKSLAVNFIGPFQDIMGRQHDAYDWSRRDKSGSFKLSLRPISDAKFTAWIDLGDVYQPVVEYPSARLPFLSTKILDHERYLILHGTLDYTIKPNIHGYVRAAHINRNLPTHLQGDALGLPWIDDAGDLYGPLSGADYNSDVKRPRIQADASLRIFAEKILGISHTFNAGVEFADITSNLDWWRQDNLLLYLDSRNPNNYFYEDRGLLAFWNCGSEQGSSLVSSRSEQLGIYVTDSFTIAKRLTFNLGLRFDRSWGWFPSGSKNLSGNPLSLFIGEALLNPYLKALYPDIYPEGLNPWDQFALAELSGIIAWNAFSPRAGLAFDVWGNGKTILKASCGRYVDPLSHRYLMPLNPLYPQNFPIYWLDANGDGQPGVEDEYSLSTLDYRPLSGAFIRDRVASTVKAPVTADISIGLDHELVKDFTLGLHFISRKQSNLLEDVLYASDTGEYWYAPGQAAAQRYWIPFTTTVPGTDSYPSQTVTLYAKSHQAPPAFFQLRNVPELERKYRALEFVFNKRLSQGWQLAGSLVLSKTEGNLGGFADETTGFSQAANSPNFFINRYGRLDTDRPLQIKLMGSIELPFQFWLSAYFQYQSGRPWQRWAQILPPADWCLANDVERIYYTINLEPPGSRREKAWSSLDLRLEKEWKLSASAKMGLFIDVSNLLGFTASLAGLNDIDRWEPTAEGAGQPGLKFLQPDYQLTSALYGKRTFRLGFRLDF